MATKKTASKGAKKSAKKKSTKLQSGAKKKRPTAKKAVKKISAKKTSAGRCTGWRAVQDNMPPGPPTLTVTGRCTFPTTGYKVTLKEAVPQGINPAILLLRKTVRPPKGIVLPVITTVKVRFVKRKATRRYTHVTILPEGKTIKVQQVF